MIRKSSLTIRQFKMLNELAAGDELCLQGGELITMLSLRRRWLVEPVEPGLPSTETYWRITPAGRRALEMEG